MIVASAIVSDLVDARFLAGVDAGRWRLVQAQFPNFDIAVAAAPRSTSPTEYCLRFDCTGYPADAPTARPWDMNEDQGLDPGAWPTGGRASAIFNPDWRRDALYLPLDRLAQAGHEGWRDAHPDRWWGPHSTIVDYLEEISDVLNARAYSGTRSTQ
jgi:hypothetical protein